MFCPCHVGNFEKRNMILWVFSLHAVILTTPYLPLTAFPHTHHIHSGSPHSLTLTKLSITSTTPPSLSPHCPSLLPQSPSLSPRNPSHSPHYRSLSHFPTVLVLYSSCHIIFPSCLAIHLPSSRSLTPLYFWLSPPTLSRSHFLFISRSHSPHHSSL